MTQEIITQTVDPMLAMIERVALSPDADISKLEKMLDMQERVLARDAKQAFFSAFSAMQSEMPEVIASAEIKHESKNAGEKAKIIAKYARFEDINEQVKPILQKYGFGIMFKPSFPEVAKIAITGTLSHIGGHYEEATMILPFDTSGAKNATQAIGSSTSYGKRYVLCGLLNISTRGEDDDARATGGEKAVIAFQAEALKEVLMGCNDVTKEWFRTTYGSVADVPRDKFTSVLTRLQAARDKAAKETVGA